MAKVSEVWYKYRGPTLTLKYSKPYSGNPLRPPCQVVVEESKTLGPTGSDKIQFILEANEGQTRGAVDAVASSGEKSRLLLLLETRIPSPHQLDRRLHAHENKMDDDGGGSSPGGFFDDDKATARSDTLRLLADEEAGFAACGIAPEEDGGAFGRRDDGPRIGESVRRVAPCAVLYDEIDAHVGGRTAVAVGRLLANQGRHSQVVVVTHTASVAALADQHLVVEKQRVSLSCLSSHSIAKDGGAAAFAGDALASNPSTNDSDSDNGDTASSTAASWRSRRSNDGAGGGGGGSGMSVAIREVHKGEREREVARMAAGDIGGGAADELARAMLRCSRRQEGMINDDGGAAVDD